MIFLIKWTRRAGRAGRSKYTAKLSDTQPHQNLSLDGTSFFGFEVVYNSIKNAPYPRVEFPNSVLDEFNDIHGAANNPILGELFSLHPDDETATGSLEKQAKFAMKDLTL